PDLRRMARSRTLGASGGESMTRRNILDRMLDQHEAVMSTVASNTTFTPKDLLELPDEGVGYELIDGELVETNVSEESSRVAMRIGHLLQVVTDTTREARVYGSDLG